MNRQQAHQTILDCYSRFHDPKYLELDPLFIVRQYLGKSEVEEIALMGALFAFGGVGQIKKSLTTALILLEKIVVPSEFSEKAAADRLQRALQGFRHRIYIDRDLVMLKLLYRRSKIIHGSLKDHFLVHHDSSAETVEKGLTGLIRDYRSWVNEMEFKPGPHFKHMLNSPEQKSACKRWLMFLKWVMREDDGIDLGIWKSPSLRADQLLIPLDTHLFKISKRLKLTRLKTANWKSALEVTRSLKHVDPVDPVKFDFSLCRIGMLQYRKMI